jgi:hypothetical protein
MTRRMFLGLPLAFAQPECPTGFVLASGPLRPAGLRPDEEGYAEIGGYTLSASPQAPTWQHVKGLLGSPCELVIRKVRTPERLER